MKRCIVIGLALSALAAGCGSDGGDESSSSDETAATVSSASSETTESNSTTSEADFIEQADAICAELNEAVADAPTETLDQIAETAELSQETVSDGIERLDELEAPASLQIGFDQFIAALEDQSAAVQVLGDAAAAGDSAGVEAAVPEVERTSERKSDVAIEVGFSECGTG